MEKCNKGRTVKDFSREVYTNDSSLELWCWGYDILRVELGRRDYEGRNRWEKDLRGHCNDNRERNKSLRGNSAPVWFSQEIFSTLSGFTSLSRPWHSEPSRKGDVWARGLIWERCFFTT